MHLVSFISSAFLIASAYAADCNNAANNNQTIGNSYPITQISFSNAGLTTSISGKIVVLSPCTFQVQGLTLTGAPATAGIQFYGMGATSFPLTTVVLSGDYNNANSPVYTFSGVTVFATGNGAGVSWKDFNGISVYATSNSWVIANTQTFSSSTPVVLAAPATATGAATSTTKAAAKSSALGLALGAIALAFPLMCMMI